MACCQMLPSSCRWPTHTHLCHLRFEQHAPRAVTATVKQVSIQVCSTVRHFHQRRLRCNACSSSSSSSVCGEAAGGSGQCEHD